MGFLLKNKKIGVLGLGNIGRSTAELLLKLDADVYGFDIKPDKKLISKTKIKLLSFDELLLTCDVICIHVSTKSGSRYLIGEKEFEKMKKDSFLVNVSRGGVVDEKALYKALKTGKLLGAAVDVFEKEPYHGPLTELDNVILTPHIGSYAKEARLEMELDSVRNLLDVFK
jgi:D-3-phosphoglycerate dehydrogenase